MPRRDPHQAPAPPSGPTPGAPADMEALQRDFAGRLAGKLDAIGAAIAAARDQPGDAALLAVAVELAHRLHGSAGAYGFPGVGLGARGVEEALGAGEPGASPRFDEALGALAGAREAAGLAPGDGGRDKRGG